MSKNKAFTINRRNFLKYTFLFTSFSFIPKPLWSFENNVITPIIRNDLEVSQASSYLNSESFQLVSFAQVTDVHIVDEGNPLRFEELKILGLDEPIFSRLAPIVGGISRKQDPYSALLWDGTIRSINEQHKLKPIDFLIATGDHSDTDLENELRCFVEIADGYLSEDYFDRTGKKAMAQVNPAGIANNLPWYAALGNHDVMYQGSVNNELLLGRLVGLVTKESINANGGSQGLLRKLSISAPDELSSMKDSIDLYQLSGHGFNNMPAPFEGYYSFTPKPFIHCIVLNTANYYPAGGILKESLSQGVLDKRQFNWMIKEIENNFDKLCIIFSHHPSTSWINFESDIKSKEFEDTLCSYENVIAHVNGHTHTNTITPVKNGNGGYWVINTCSIIDFPQEWRKITIYNNGNGIGSIKTQMFRHNNQTIYQIACNNADTNSSGLDIDRDVELLFSIPKTVSYSR
jgi:3',5'-cyclic AMP phosphodiesterase CpdA